MSFFSSFLGIAGLIGSAVGLIGGAVQSDNRSSALDSAAASRNRSNEIEKQKQVLQNRRQRVQTVREARIKRARSVSVAQSQNAQGSVRGAFGSIISQANSNQQFASMFQGLTGLQNTALFESSQYRLQARQYGESANLFSSVGGVSASIFSNNRKIAGLFT